MHLTEVIRMVENNELTESEINTVLKDALKLVKIIKSREDKGMPLSIRAWIDYESPQVKDRLVADVYEDYLGFCKNMAMEHSSQIIFGKMMFKEFGVEGKLVTVKGKTGRKYL